MNRQSGVLAMVLGLLAAAPARADKRELYTLIGYEAGVGRFNLPAVAGAATTRYAGALDLTGYYGVTNDLHLGGRLRLTASSDLRFTGRTVAQGDGTQVTGDVFMDHRALSIGGLVLYRFDTGASLAPALEVGAGISVHQYRNVAIFAVGSAVGTALPSDSETRFYATGTLLLEYRFLDRWVASVGAGVQAEPGAMVPWTVILPVRVGRIWW